MLRSTAARPASRTSPASRILHPRAFAMAHARRSVAQPPAHVGKALQRLSRLPLVERSRELRARVLPPSVLQRGAPGVEAIGRCHHPMMPPGTQADPARRRTSPVVTGSRIGQLPDALCWVRAHADVHPREGRPVMTGSVETFQSRSTPPRRTSRSSCRRCSANGHPTSSTPPESGRARPSSTSRAARVSWRGRPQTGSEGAARSSASTSTTPCSPSLAGCAPTSIGDTAMRQSCRSRTLRSTSSSVRRR